MPTVPTNLSAECDRLREEACRLLDETSLRDLLRKRFGMVHVVGSHALSTMTWRDLDLYVPCAADDRQRFVETLPLIHSSGASAGYVIFKAVFNDEHLQPRGNYGEGLYFGLRISTPQGNVWKIDLWGWEADMLVRKLAEHRELNAALAAVDREALLDLKWRLQRTAGFRDRYTSYDAYKFLIAGGGSFTDFVAACDAQRRSASE